MQRSLPHRASEMRGLSLRKQFVIFGLSIAIPVLLFGAWAVGSYSAAEREATEQKAQAYARDFSKSVEHELRRMADQLVAMSGSQALATGDFAILYRRAKQASEIYGATIIVRDASGQQVVNTYLPWGEPLPTSNLPAESAGTLAAGRIYISNLYEGAVKKRPIATVTIPILRDGQLAHSISMSIEPSNLLKGLGITLPPEGWIAVVSGRDGRLIATSRNLSDMLGRPMTPTGGDTNARAGIDEITNLAGERVLRAFHRMAFSEWTAVVLMPIEKLERPFAVRWQTLAWAGLGLLTITGGLAAGMANNLIRQFRGLSEQASALVMGAPITKRPSRLREVNEVIESLRTASAQASARTAAIRDSELQLRTVLDGCPVGMFRTDLDKNTIYVNPQLCEMANTTMEEMNGRKWLDVLPAESRAALESDWAADVAEHGFFERAFTALSVRRGLGIVNIQFTAVPERDASGKVVGYIGTVTDITKRKRAEKALNDEIDRFKRLTSVSPDAIYLHDMSSHEFTFLNANLNSALGLPYATETTVGAARIRDRLHSDDIDILEAHEKRMRAATDGAVHSVDVRVVPPNGRAAVWIQIRAVVFTRHDDGRVNKVLGIATDITERRQSEAARVAEIDHFKRMAEASPDVVYLFDVRENTWTQLNHSLGSVLGYGIASGEASGNSTALFELVHPDSFQDLRAHIERVRQARDGRAERVEFRARAVDGSARWFLNRSVVFDRAGDGSAHRILGIATDITARKRAEQLLAEENDRFKRMALVSPDLVYLYDRQLKEVSYLSRSLREALGYPPAPDAAPGAREMLELIHPDDLAGAHRHVKDMAAMPDGQYLEETSRFRAPDGNIRWLRNRSVVFSRNPDGRVHQLLGIATDITESMRNKEAIERSHAELEIRVADEVARREQTQLELVRAHNLEAIGRLTGGVAHDFNNMLSVISTSLQLFKAEQGSKVALDDIDAALAGAETGRRLTQQLLSFARRQPLDPVPIALGEHLGSMVRWIRSTLGEDIDVRTTFPADLGRIRVEEAGFDSAVINLIMNARDAMPDGGALLIDTGNIRLAHAADDGTPAGDYVFLAITDNGVGMTAEVAREAITPFFTTKAEHGGGTGLGLSSVYGFMKQSRGRLEIRSQPGQGTSVILYFPSAAGSEDLSRNRAGEADASVIRGKGQTILVVEDMTKLRELIARMLRSVGYRCLEAENGVEARAMIEKSLAAGTPLDAVVSDVRMPGGVSGPDLAHWIEEHAPEIAVVLVTAYDDGRQASQEHADGRARRPVVRLPKPFSAAQITHGLQEAWALVGKD